MALSFFKQRDIDQMTPDNIPEALINYFETLDDQGKITLLQGRQDLAAALGFSLPNNNDGGAGGDFSGKAISDADAAYKYVLAEREEEIEKAPEENSIDEFASVRISIYDGKNLKTFVHDNMPAVEALAVGDGKEKCPIHRKAFLKKQIRFTSDKYPTYGLVLMICLECHRAFLESSKMDEIKNALRKRNVSCRFYDLSLSNRYLRSIQPIYQLSESEKIYYVEPWIQEQPVCPIHQIELSEIKCEKRYKDRKIDFTAYICDSCEKIIMRRASVMGLTDECARAGIPLISYLQLRNEKAPKKAPLPKDIKPDYIVENGRRLLYSYDHVPDTYLLSEEDIVVVSDSQYCSLRGHSTKEGLGLIQVDQRRDGKKAYLVLVGYCSHCRKYYLDVDDYRRIASYGRIKATIYLDFDEPDQTITSGEVYNLERNHFNETETVLKQKIADIENSDDYVSPFAVGDYDDGNLAYAKRVSKEKYSKKLGQLDSYVKRPYLYRVDISDERSAETYYIGAQDIDLGNGKSVISANSDFGHELINYQTRTVRKQGKDFRIRLTRQFDIENAYLYGYRNLRTDEDLIFQKGITDPFLVRVLNMRKRQHSLTDIFVTIQENQNKIVNAPFNENIIVHGCAGSGKTMVLLHRLSALQYKERRFDFSKNALILTPSTNFSLHIRGLADELQIGNIQSMSVEQYYQDILLHYRDLVQESRIRSEMDVSGELVIFVYSDRFLDLFSKAINTITEQRTLTESEILRLNRDMGLKERTIPEGGLKTVQQFRIVLDSLNNEINQRANNADKVQKDLRAINTRKDYLFMRVPKSDEMLSRLVSRCMPEVYEKINSYLSSRQERISSLQQQRQNMVLEREKTANAFLVFGRRNKLAEIDNALAEIDSQIATEVQTWNQELVILQPNLEGATNLEMLNWFKQVEEVIGGLQKQIQSCEQLIEENRSLERELATIDSTIKAKEDEYQAIANTLYSGDIKQRLEKLYEKVDDFYPIRIFRQAFALTLTQNGMDPLSVSFSEGDYRFSLYAKLRFVMKYYGNINEPYSFICVDEGQDLAINEYKLIRQLNQNKVTYNIFGDTNQLIQKDRGIASWDMLNQLGSFSHFELNENYRNTNQITKFCNSSFQMNVLQTGVDGPEIREIVDAELLDELTSSNFQIDRVVVLFPRTIGKENYFDNQLLPSIVRGNMGNKIEKGKIALLYVDEAKGLEFDKAFVIDSNMVKNERYIAFTRALTELVLVVNESMNNP